MLKWALVFFCLSLQAAEPAALDYWEKSPELWKKLTEDRQILVSAKDEEGRTISRGAGLVKARVSEIWAFATNTEKIKTSSRFIKEFKWDQSSGDVEMLIEMIGISYRLRGKALPKPDPENPKVELAVHEGSLVPFTALLEIRSPKAQAAIPGAPTFAEGSLVRLYGVSSRDRALSWPLRVALEAVLQRSAGHLRTAVESEKEKVPAEKVPAGVTPNTF